MEALGECYLYGQPVTAPIFGRMSWQQAAKHALLHRRVNCIKKSKISCSASHLCEGRPCPALGAGAASCSHAPCWEQGTALHGTWLYLALFITYIVLHKVFSFCFFFFLNREFQDQSVTSTTWKSPIPGIIYLPDGLIGGCGC